MIKTLTLTSAILLIISLSQCAPTSDSPDPDPVSTSGYHSDYFVFIADDDGSPLVIPADFNWFQSDDVLETEFKGWYGTSQDWPIAYQKQPISRPDVPSEIWDLPAQGGFTFDEDRRTINLAIEGAPAMSLLIPEPDQWQRAPFGDSFRELYGFRTSAQVEGQTRTGWMIYERIRPRPGPRGGFGGFAAFYWMPLVVDGTLYYFQQHRGQQQAARWSVQDGAVTADTLGAFTLDVLNTTADPVSGRDDIAQVIRLQAPPLDITLESQGEQVGHGERFPKGLAYYRQSLLSATSASASPGYGMLELILEDD